MQRLTSSWQKLPRPLRIHLIVLTAYSLFTLLVTLPTIFNLESVVYGQYTDGSGYIWRIWWRKYTLLQDADWRFLTMGEAPFGAPFAYRDYPGLYLVLGGLAAVFDEVVAYNLAIIGAYIATAFLTYLLATRLIRRYLVAALAGLIVAFSPFAVDHAQQHLDLAQQWLLPLFLLALWHLRQRRSIGAALLLGGAFALTAYIQVYYAFYNAIAAVTFALAEAAAAYRRTGWSGALDGQRWGLYLLAGGAGVMLYLPELIPLVQLMADTMPDPLRPVGIIAQPLEWFYVLSARPWDFLIPSPTNPLLGGLARMIYDAVENIQRLDFASPTILRHVDLGAHWMWATEAETVYLGWVNLVAGGWAAQLALRGKLKNAPDSGQDSEGPTTAERHFWGIFAVVLLAVAIWFALPPLLPVGAVLRHISEPLHAVVIPTGSWLTMQLLSPLRDPARFTYLAMLALSLLVTVGLDRALRRWPSRRVWILAGFTLLLVVEFAHMPNHHDINHPEEYLWLAEQPRDSIVAVFPHSDRAHQRLYELPTVDAPSNYDAGLNPDNYIYVQRLGLSALTAADVPGKLAALQTDYVLNREAFIETPATGLDLLFTTPGSQVFTLTADPVPLIVTYTPSGEFWQSAADWRWQGKIFTFYVWHTYQEPARLRIVIETDGTSRDSLVAGRQMTPHPARISLSGIMQDNPYLPDPYPAETPVATDAAGHFVFDPLVLGFGETIVTLRWEGDSPAGGYPEARIVAIELLNPPPAHE